MKRWHRPCWLVMAFLALLASVVPSQGWACPMTGQIGDAKLVCRGVMPTSDSTQLCAHLGGTCCKLTPFPILPIGKPDDTRQGASYAPAFSSGNALAFNVEDGAVVVHIIAELPETPRFVEAPQTAPTPTAASPPFLHHRPAPLAARAPPSKIAFA